MKPFSILLIRILGLYLFLSTIFAMMPALLAPDASELWSDGRLAAFLATLIVPTVGGVLLWWLAGHIAKRLHAESPETSSDSAACVRDDDLVRAGTFLIGLYLFVRHLAAVLGRVMPRQMLLSMSH